MIRRIVWNSTEGRVRAGWRILCFTLLWIYAPLSIFRLTGEWLSVPLRTTASELADLAPQGAFLGVRLVVVVACTLWAVWALDHRTLADFGLSFNRVWWLDFGFGLALGALLMGLIFVTEWLAGWVTVVDVWHVQLPGVTVVGSLLGALLIFTVISITEEFLARGYHLRNLAEGFNFPGSGPRVALLIAWLISSSLFGLLHVFNPNATWYSTLALMVVGLFFGLGFVLTGSLAIPLGLHLTWNFFQGSVFGFPVSGNSFDGVSIVVIEQGGPALWTGGAFGPEAGLIGAVAILLGCGLTVGWVRWRQGRVQLMTELAEWRPLQEQVVET